MRVVTLEVPELGNRCHLVHDGDHALVVDPPRDVTTVERAAEEHGVEIVAVADTHIHNDYVSGALALARRHGADYLLSADEPAQFERVGVRDGDVLDVGRLEVTVMATPGHTRHHQAFVAREPGRPDDPGALLSGGSLLHGTVGRTDLIDPRLTYDLARAQWASARSLGALAPALRLLPTHGFGSFCASTPVAGAPGSEVGDQLLVNPVLLREREEWVDELVSGFGAIPSYYRHMGPLNRAGAGRALPRPGRVVSEEQVSDAVLAGRWVIDLRPRDAFADGHLPGTVNVEYSHQFATYVGWLVPWGDPLVLLDDSADNLGSALRDLSGIGIEGVDVHTLDAAAPLTATYRRADWATFRESAGPRVVVDVRQRDEYDAGHLPDAVHLPVQEIARHGNALPTGELWVHCRSGYRAGIAASLLHRMGHRVVHVDDTWERAVELAVARTGGIAA